MYIPKHCPECGENRSLFVETRPNFLGCQACGMEFKIELTFDADAPVERVASCDNCGTKKETGCSFYTARDCGSSFSLWTPIKR